MINSPKIHIYIDSSGRDNWSNTKDQHYIFAVLTVCHEMDNWKEWQEIHQTKLGGRAHFCEPWEPGKKVPIIHHLLTNPPWIAAGVMIVHQEQYLKNLRKYAQIGDQNIPDDLASTCIWTEAPFIIARSLQKNRPQIIEGITFHNPGQGLRARCAIASKCILEIDKPPHFANTGNPGIDAVDGLAWIFQRYFKTGEKHFFPYPIDSDLLQKSGIALAHFAGPEPIWFSSITDYKKWTSEQSFGGP